MKRAPKKRKLPQRVPSKPFNKVFRDPVHDLIRIDEEDRFILDLIDTKEFQRLRRIRQLGLGHFVYPGAEHTRFVHSLGVFNFARRMIERLRARSKGKRTILKELSDNARTLKAAALLHDIGHGPFSHVFERAFLGEGTVDHETWSCRILWDNGTQIHKELVRHKINIDEVASLIAGKLPNGELPPLQPYLVDIVHGQLDADRMDYLLRDSLMTGSRYGQYDSEWILNVLAIGKMTGRQKHLKKLCLDRSKGIGAIEGLLHARFLMTKHVYGHKTTRAYEAELKCTLALAAHLVDDLPPDTPEPVRGVLATRGDVTVAEYLMLDDEVMWWALRRWAVSKVSGSGRRRKLAEALRRHSRRLVRRERPWAGVGLTEVTLGHATVLCNQLAGDADNELRFECHLDEMPIWPYKDPGSTVRGGGDSEDAFYRDIYLLNSDGNAVPMGSLLAESPVLKALSKPWLGARFFFDRSFSKEFTGRLKKFGVC